jgi:hypothetical protein
MFVHDGDDEMCEFRVAIIVLGVRLSIYHMHVSSTAS